MTTTFVPPTPQEQRPPQPYPLRLTGPAGRPAELDASGAAVLTDGTFAIGAGPQVYLISGGRRRWVPDPTTLLALAPNGWASVVKVDDATLQAVPEGAPLPSREDKRVYRGDQSAPVYVIESLSKHHIPDADTLAGYGGWPAVVVIAQADCDAIPEGAPIPSVDAGATTIDAYLRSLSDLAVQPPNVTRTPAGSGSVTNDGGIDYTTMLSDVALCTLQNQPWIASPVADVLYPGALIQASSLASGLLAPVPGGLKRAGGTVTVTTDLVHGGTPKTSSQDVTETGLNTVQDARQAILAALQPNDSATSFDFEETQIRSLQSGFAKLGVSVNSGSFSGSLNVSVDESVQTSTTMVLFWEVFYSVVFTPPSGDNAFFDASVTLDQVKSVCGPDKPPCYLSQIDYGRLLILTATSTESSLKVAAALKAAMGAAKSSNGSIEIDAGDAQTLSQSTVSVMVSGSTGASGMQLLQNPIAGLTQFLNSGGSFSPNNPGLPIRYTARYAGSRDVAAVNIVANYQDTVGISAPNLHNSFQVWDGPHGGPVNTGMRVGPGDQMTIAASGTNWSGVVLTGTYGPEGWTSWATPGDGGKGYPLPNNHPFGLCGTWGDGDTGNGKWFWIGKGISRVSGLSSADTLYLGTNDNDPFNGSDSDKFTVVVDVVRSSNPDDVHLPGVATS